VRQLAFDSWQVEIELDEEEQIGAEAAPPGDALEASDDLQFLREVDEHQAMLTENMRRAEALAQRMHEDAAMRRRQARERAKNALLQAAAAEVAAANCHIDALKRDVALKLASRSRPATASLVEGGWEEGLQGGSAEVKDDA
jgi:hypothetical protein